MTRDSEIPRDAVCAPGAFPAPAPDGGETSPRQLAPGESQPAGGLLWRWSGDAVTAPIGAPISVNNLYVNIPRRGRVASPKYKKWRKAGEALALSGGPIRAVAGAVEIQLLVPEAGVSAGMDTDNVAKAYVDLLVRLGVIEDDNKKIVRALSVRWIEGRAGYAVVTPF